MRKYLTLAFILGSCSANYEVMPSPVPVPQTPQVSENVLETFPYGCKVEETKTFYDLNMEILEESWSCNGRDSIDVVTASIVYFGEPRLPFYYEFRIEGEILKYIDYEQDGWNQNEELEPNPYEVIALNINEDFSL